MFGGTHADTLGFLMMAFFSLKTFFCYRYFLEDFFTAELFLIYGCLSLPATTGTVLFVVFTAQIIGFGTI